MANATPNYFKVREHFNATAVANDHAHEKEELMLFPWVRKMVKAEKLQRNR